MSVSIVSLDARPDVDLEGGLVPLRVAVEDDSCVYVEPNVWIHHLLA